MPSRGAASGQAPTTGATRVRAITVRRDESRRTNMAVTPEMPAGATAIRPFKFEVSEAEIEELRARIAATRWPEKETVADQSQGVPLAVIQKLARYWMKGYDWRTSGAHPRTGEPRV